MKLAIMTPLVVAALLAVTALQYVRPVNAEDDCAMPTWSVNRLPIVGLVCIGE